MFMIFSQKLYSVLGLHPVSTDFFLWSKVVASLFFKKKNNYCLSPTPPITSSFNHLSGTGVLSSSNGGLTGLASWCLQEATDRALRVRAPPGVPVFNYWVSFPFFYSPFLSSLLLLVLTYTDEFFRAEAQTLARLASHVRGSELCLVASCNRSRS